MIKLHGLKNEKTGKDLIGAIVIDEDNGDSTLYSYYTPIVAKKADGSIVRIATNDMLKGGELSKTTALHLKHFCGLTKEGFYALNVQ